MLKFTVPVFVYRVESFLFYHLGDLYESAVVTNGELLPFKFGVGIASRGSTRAGRIARGPKPKHAVTVAGFFPGGQQKAHVRVEHSQGKNKLTEITLGHMYKGLKGTGGRSEPGKRDGHCGAPEMFAQPMEVIP